MPGRYKPDSGIQLVELESGDIQLGAVELKNGATDDRAVINAANTARATSTVVLAVQAVDAAGAVLSTSGLATSAKQLADGHNVAVSNMITGFATSAKQLADGHNVAVSNFPTEYPLPAATVSTLTPPAAITGFATETGGNLAAIATYLAPQASANVWAQLTEPAYTATYDAARINTVHVFTATLANKNTNVDVQILGNIVDATASAYLLTTEARWTDNGTYVLTSTVPARYVWFRFKAESGGTDATIDASYMGAR